MDQQLINIAHQIIDGIEDRASFFSTYFQRVLIIYDALDPSFLMSIMHEKIKSMRFFQDAEIDWLKTEPLQKTVKISPPRRDYDLIITTPFLHRIIDVPGVLIQMRASLSARGVLVSPLVGHESFEPLKQMLSTLDIQYLNGIQQRFFPMISMKDAGRLLVRATFDSCVSDFIRLPLALSSFKDLKKALQVCHENYIYRPEYCLSQSSPQKLFSKHHLTQINEKFNDLITKEQLFMDIIYMVGWLNPVPIASPSTFDCCDIKE